MTKKMKKKLQTIVLALIVYGVAVVVTHLYQVSGNVELVLFLVAYMIIGYTTLTKAIRNIRNGQVFDENFLMAVATVGAFLIGEYPEGVAVMLFYQIGELFESYAVNRSRNSITELMDIAPDYANLKTEEGIRTVDPDEVSVGDIIVIKPGEKVPLDAVVLCGSSALDTRALTGEALPREVSEHDALISGCINLNGVLEARVEKEFGESTVTKILNLVENASSQKAKTENFISKFAKYYTPIVVFSALAVGLIPPLLMGGKDFSVWIYRALSFLVISCPCALVISVPLSFFGGIGGASRRGILVKGSNYLEALSKAEIAVFDKTGTLTKGSFSVKEVISPLGNEKEVLQMAASAEQFSNHPIASALRKAAQMEDEVPSVKDVQELAGFGVQATVDKKTVAVGNARLMEKMGIQLKDVQKAGTMVYVAVDGIYQGTIVIADTIKEDAKRAIEGLKKENVKQLVMLSGDAKIAGEAVAKELGLTRAYMELLPADKVDHVEKLFQEKSEKGTLIFVGDGMNDAPVLARADVGIAMGGLGSDAAIEAADLVIMNDEPSKIVEAIKIAKKTMIIVKENIVFAIGIKVLVLILAAVGLATMWAAVFADVGVSVIAILNAMRAMRAPKMK